MACVMNASAREQTAVVCGNYFTFKPGQCKVMSDEFSRFITNNKKTQGFVSVPDELSDINYANSKEGQAIKAKAREMGVMNRIAYLSMLINNERDSLQQDLDKKGIKTGYSHFATPNIEAWMQEMVEYQTKLEDESKRRAERVKELEAKLEG